jgi:polysaccharide export outer membrane protein
MRPAFTLTMVVYLGLFHVGLARPMPDERGMGEPAFQAQQSAPQSIVGTGSGLAQDYRLGAGDTLEIQVIGSAELSQTLKVSAGGDINFHPVGVIGAEDLTAAELEAKIASALLDKKLLTQPEVLIYVREYQAKRIYLMGEFGRAGELIMSQQLTVTDAIFLAGGLAPFADRYGYLHRRMARGSASGPPPESVVAKPDLPREGVEILKVDLQPVSEGRAIEPDIALRQGDCLIVPRRTVEFYFVLGSVLRPLNYLLPNGQPLMASQAISEAGGPTATAKMSKGMLVRYDKEGKRQELKVDYAAILRGKQTDFVVQSNDVIFIPGSNIKTVAEGFVDVATSSIMATAFRVGRSYQLPEGPNQSNP